MYILRVWATAQSEVETEVTSSQWKKPTTIAHRELKFLEVGWVDRWSMVLDALFSWNSTYSTISSKTAAKALGCDLGFVLCVYGATRPLFVHMWLCPTSPGWTTWAWFIQLQLSGFDVDLWLQHLVLVPQLCSDRPWSHTAGVHSRQLTWLCGYICAPQL